MAMTPGDLVRVQLPAPLAAGPEDRVLATALVLGPPRTRRAVAPYGGGVLRERYRVAPVALLGADARPRLLWLAVERLAAAMPSSTPTSPTSSSTPAVERLSRELAPRRGPGRTPGRAIARRRPR
jgi:hypothetical protein